MVNVSENFKAAMKEPVKEIQAFINYDEGSINDSDDLISFKVSCDSGLCKTAMRKLEATYLGNHNLIGKWVRAGFGVRLPDGEFEYLNYGSFLVSEQTVTKDTETTNIVAYDKMVNAMTPYDVKLFENIEYPINLLTYTKILGAACGLDLGGILGDTEVSIIQCFDRGNMFSLYNALNTMPESISVEGACYQENASADIQTIQGAIDIQIADENITQAKHITIDLQGYELCSVAGISDTITIKNGNITLTKAIVKIDSYNGENVGADNWYISSMGTLETGATVYYVSDKVQEINLGGIILPELFEGKNHITLTSNIEPTNFRLNYYSIPVVYNPMNDWKITQELWENIEGITYRDIFQQIAQATGTTCIIGADDMLYFKRLADTNEKLTYDNMFKLKLEDKYGEINSVVLSRTPSEDNVYLRNEASIETNGLTEFKIENNEIIDKDRENAITPIFDVLNGVYYYPFEATTEGLGWYEIGDNIDIVNDAGEVFKTSLFNYTITIDGSVKETLKTTAESKTQTQYQYASTVTKQLKNTELIVNKQENYIQSLVKDMYEEDGVVNEKFTSIKQDIENITFNVQNSVGSNLIKNSVMFAYDNENKPYNWELEGDGTLTIVSDVDFQKSGGLSCHGFTLSNKTVRTDKIPVKCFDENNPLYYSFSTKLKTEYTSDCRVRIYNPDINEEYIIDLSESEATTDSAGNLVIKEFSFNGIMPKGDYFIIEFSCLGDSEATFTDNMLSIGEQSLQWSQANGEVMNTQVNISLDGIVVRSDTVLGDYTVISKYEFAGYSNINGTMTKVFTLNKGTTEVKELLAKDSIAMAPLRIVPVTEGDMQGWAIVLA